MDMASGYYQVPLAEEDKEKTAFTTRAAGYTRMEYNVMPFGLCNAPATFQRNMEVILSGLNWACCLVYIDDIIIYSRSFEEHLGHLDLVLERLGKAGMAVKMAKCKFARRELSFLGHVVDAKGVRPDPEKCRRPRRSRAGTPRSCSASSASPTTTTTSSASPAPPSA